MKLTVTMDLSDAEFTDGVPEGSVDSKQIAERLSYCLLHRLNSDELCEVGDGGHIRSECGHSIGKWEIVQG